MNQFAESCAAACRDALELRPNDLPTKEHIERFIESLPKLRYVTDWQYPVPCYHGRGAEADGMLFAPPGATAAQLCHETMHHLGGAGLASFLRLMAEIYRTPELYRLAQVSRCREEADAEAFVVAMFLPWEMVLRHTDYQLADLTGWSLDVIRKRRWEVLRWCWARGIDLAEFD